MWSIAHPASPAWSDQPLAPVDVLYEFDGPLTFTAALGFFDALFHKIGVRGASHFFIATETSGEVISALRGGRLSVRGALQADRYWVVETDQSLRVIRYWSCSYEELPQKFLPKTGVPIFAHLNLAPDSLEQASAFFAMGFKGQELTRQGMPFSLFRSLVNSAYDAARRILSPVFLSGAKSTTFDFQVQEPVFGSLILALGDPNVNPVRLKQRTAETPITLESIREHFASQREFFFDEMDELVAQAERGGVKDSLAAERFSLLDNVQHIIPSDESRINRVEFSGLSGSNIRTLVVGEREGTLIHRAFKRVERQPITEVGDVEIINSKRNSFVYRSQRGKQVTCYVDAHEFSELLKDPGFRNGALVRVYGHLTKRPRRDEMQAERPPEIIKPVILTRVSIT